MVNTYHSIASQISKLEHAKKSSIFDNINLYDSKFDSQDFVRVYELLKERYYATYSLFGEQNFKEVCFIYLKTNPLHAFKEGRYGENFPNFLATLKEMQNFYFVRFIAMLDWFWFSTSSPKNKIQLPKGTLKSWGTVIKGQPLIEVEMNETELETLSIQKNGKEYRIIEHD